MLRTSISFFALALVVAAAAPVGLSAQTAGLSASNAFVYDWTPAFSGCNSSALGTATSLSCPGETVPGGTGMSMTASSNALRSASASGTLTKTGGSGPITADAQANTRQASALTVTGTPSPTDRLVFHFIGAGSATGSGGGAIGDAYGFWQLVLTGNNDGNNVAGTNQYGYSDGTQSPVYGYHSTQTGTGADAGFDMWLAFVPGSTFTYNFFVNAGGYEYGSDPDGTTVSGSVSVRLAGIDATAANGTLISQATFDPLTGLGAISATPTTAPEPGMLALVGTGLLVLPPFARRSRRKQWLA